MQPKTQFSHLEPRFRQTPILTSSEDEFRVTRRRLPFYSFGIIILGVILASLTAIAFAIHMAFKAVQMRPL